jgi:hypothetical protein
VPKADTGKNIPAWRRGRCNRASLGLGQLSGPAVGALLADWFGPLGIGWFAAAVYGAGMLAAAAAGFFGRTRITT